MQLEQNVLPAIEYVPAAQNTHAARLVDPDTCEYVLSGHRTHCSTSIAPCDPRYVPAGHCAHWDPPQYVPGRHDVGVGVGAGVGAGVATGAGVGACVGAGVGAALHEALPSAEIVPLGHATQAVASVAPGTAEYVLEGHRRHVQLPMADDALEYVPAAHVPQLAPPARNVHSRRHSPALLPAAIPGSPTSAFTSSTRIL